MDITIYILYVIVNYKKADGQDKNNLVSTLYVSKAKVHILKLIKTDLWNYKVCKKKSWWFMYYLLKPFILNFTSNK